MITFPKFINDYSNYQRAQAFLLPVFMIRLFHFYNHAPDHRANFTAIIKRHTGESQCSETSRKYWILVFAGTTTRDF